jgi:hypothetical protein
MAHKYKLKEAPTPNLAAQVGAEIGDVSYSKDGDTKFVVNSIDKETGQIGWKVIELPAFDKLNDDVDELVSTAKGVYTKTKSDEEFRKIYEEARLLRNKIRKHLRNEYPDEYKRMTMEGEVDEVSMSGAAGAYNTPYAFRKKGAKADDEAYKQLGYKLVKEKALPLVRKKLAKVPKAKKSTSKYKMKLPSGMVSSLGYTMGEGKLGDGADLGPGPKAGPDGVTDSAYTKQFKYKLVPKTKDGTYVQKGSGMIVKKLF